MHLFLFVLTQYTLYNYTNIRRQTTLKQTANDKCNVYYIVMIVLDQYEQYLQSTLQQEKPRLFYFEIKERESALYL